MKFLIDDPIVQAFKTEVHDLAHEIDPENERYWFDLSLGWALGKGLNADDAGEFASFIRYYTPLG